MKEAICFLYAPNARKFNLSGLRAPPSDRNGKEFGARRSGRSFFPDKEDVLSSILRCSTNDSHNSVDKVSLL